MRLATRSPVLCEFMLHISHVDLRFVSNKCSEARLARHVVVSEQSEWDERHGRQSREVAVERSGRC